MVVRIVSFLRKCLLWLFVVLLIVFFVIYAWSPIYNFPGSVPFSGSKIYNPYHGIDSTAWKKGNFQIQSKVWFGITDGRNNSNEAIHAVYKQLCYDIIVISDYMKINQYGAESRNFIPTYEHGYGIRKTHQVCIGSDEVNWIDYPLYQNRNHKQHIINILHQHNKIVALAHPDLRDGYTLDDMHYLTNYDLIEVLNQCRFSIGHWDAALSSGHAAFIIANDDAHDLFKPDEVGMVCTFINTPSLNCDAVIDSLKKGKAYGVNVFMKEGSDLVKKAEDHKKIPFIKSLEVLNDTLFVSVSEPFHDIVFFGQDGTRRKMTTNSKTAFYKILPNDTYIRSEITFPGSTRFYLNPVFRYSGSGPEQPPKPLVDQTKTWLQRGVAMIFAVLIGILIFRLRRINKKGKRSSHNKYYFSL